MGLSASKTNQEPMALLHTTSLENATKILSSGRLLTGLDLYKNNVYATGFSTGGWYPDEKACPGQYPGVYFSVLFPANANEEIPYPGNSEVILVFCTALLDRTDYHWNPQDQNGHISSETLNSDEFSQAVLNDPDFLQQIRPDRMNELVVHHSVPLTFLREIWVPTEEVQAIVKSHLINMSQEYPVIVKQRFPLKTYTCMGEVERMNPNLCFCFDRYERLGKTTGFTEKMEFYRKLAVSCGLSEKFAATYGESDIKQLNGTLVPIVNKNFLNVLAE